VVSLSSFYETEPAGFTSENLFLNAACHVRTKLNPFEVLAITKEIEQSLGRKSKTRRKQYADRIIDLDVLLFDDLIIETKELTLPHPYMHERGFVLFPLGEIAGNVVHPVSGKTVRELAAGFPEQLLPK
jgi:2-amino-4-hydroxy-6-hydroxymethyldihydropteridine diphosphokinase